MYDLIGDIHGHADKLEQLLQKLGYQKDASGIYRHATRKVVFVGDFIDRGPKIREVLQIAKAMLCWFKFAIRTAVKFIKNYYGYTQH